MQGKVLIVFSRCGDFASPMPGDRVGRLVRAYVQVVIIVLVLALGVRLGADPIVMIGWGALAWLLLGRMGGAGGCVGVGRRVR